MQFQFSTAHNIVFGTGTSKTIPDHALRFGKKACLVTGRSPERFKWLIDEIYRNGDSPLLISVSGEPDTDFITSCAAQARLAGCDMVIAIGGGSVLDAGKALAALLTNRRHVLDYLEVVGNGMPLDHKPAPCIAVPTTSGTGSEVTANAFLLSSEHKVKVSMRSSDMIPDLAVIDPELTVSMPPSITAATGLDALTQLMEAFVSRFATPMTSPLCKEGMAHAARALRTAFINGKDIEARSSMSLASLLSGIALANAKLGAVHGFAAPLGGRFKAPHGTVCAALLPQVMKANIRALTEREPENPALKAYSQVAGILTGRKSASLDDGIEWVRELCADLEIPGLAALGVTEMDFNEIAAKAARASSMKGNPVVLTEKELLKILRKAM